MTYKALKTQPFKIKKLKDNQIECWKIKSKSEFPFGVSYLNYKFSKEYGFVEFIYENYNKENLAIRLVEIE